ncbi:transposase [Cupriavidus sp. YAF13]|uniref:transposase n=1 Tax=Cupriavidus sp. YAF13 TaxID=3233075 RepID=UPI003F92EBDC
MPKTRPPYSTVFRQQVVDLVHAGRSPEDLAKEFEPTAQTIYNWVAQAERDAGTRHDGLDVPKVVGKRADVLVSGSRPSVRGGRG